MCVYNMSSLMQAQQCRIKESGNEESDAAAVPFE